MDGYATISTTILICTHSFAVAALFFVILIWLSGSPHWGGAYFEGQVVIKILLCGIMA